MKYYELFRYESNPVGGSFAYCKVDDLEKGKKEFMPDRIREISQVEYKDGIERQSRRSLRLATGYPR